MRILTALAILLSFSPSVAEPVHQDPGIRPRVCLNGEWQFQPSDNDLSFPPNAEWDAVPIRIPSPWNVNSFSRRDGGDFECFPSYPKSWENVLAAWHRRSFTVPESMRGKAIFLRFEAVHYWADVYLNGKKAGSHEGGFTPFELNVTDLVGVGEPNELLVGVKAHQLFNVKGRATYGWGSFWGGHIHGIWQDVWLIARPEVHISDAFVMTSVENREITLQLTVANLTIRAREIRVNNHVFDADKPAPGSVPAKGFARAHVTLGAGETKTITLKEPWASPKLWWPHDAHAAVAVPPSPGRRGAGGEASHAAHLYILVTRLYPDDEDNTPLDMKRTRFGFREFRIGRDNRKFELNGVTWSGRGDAWHFMGIPQMTPAYARAWYEMARSCNVNIIRLHAQVYPEFYLDVADEMGMLIVDETALWGSAINFYYNDDFLRRARDHCRKLVLRDRNHPSVVLWSVANEIYARRGDDNAPSQDWIFARYAELAEEMRKLDPTREVSSDGDGDLNGRLSIYSAHYPGAGDPNKGKITTIGEAGSMFYSTPPEVAHAIGDRAYLTSNDRMKAIGIEVADLIEGYRKWAAYATPFNIAWYGLEPLPMDVTFEYDDLKTPGVKPERLGPYCTMLNAGRDPKLPAFKPNPLYHAVKDAFEPIRFFVKERSRMLWAGEKVTRHLTVHNDVLEASALLLTWELTARDRGVAKGALELDLAPGDTRECEIAFTPSAPDAQRQPARNALRLRLARAGEVCYEQTLQFDVVSRSWVSSTTPFWTMTRPGGEDPAGKQTALFDPTGATSKVLASLGIQSTRVSTPEELAASGAPIRVVGAGSRMTADQAQRVEDSSEALLVFESNPAFYGDASYCSRRPATCRRAFSTGPMQQTMMGDAQMRFWGDDGVVARAACGRDAHGNIIPLVRCGDGDIAMFLAFDAKRPRVFSELALIEKAAEEPAAAILAKIAFHQLARTPWLAPRTARVLGAPKSRFTAALAVLGARTTEQTPHVMLCDGSQPPANLQAVRAFTGAPGQSWDPKYLALLGLTPATLEAWNKALRVELSLQPSDAAQLVRMSGSSGINHRDLFWIEKNNTRRIMDWGVSCDAFEAMPLLVTNHTDWRRWCWRGENTKTAAIIRSEREPFTPQTGLLEVTCGTSQLVVSQVRLDPMNPKSMRFYNQLLTNLGVPLRRGKATDLDLTAFNTDPDGFITAWLLCGPFDGDEPHDTDFVGGEAELRPEIGTVSGQCIWSPFRARGPLLDFTQDKVFGKRENCAAYAGAYVKAPRDMTANLWLGSDDQVKVWLNGRLVHDHAVVRPVAQDSDKVNGLELKAGWNFLLLKVSQEAGHWGLCARLVNDEGKPLEELTVSPTGPPAERQAVSREAWTATASPSGEGPQNAIDGDEATRWSSGKPMAPGMWFQLDLGRTETVTQIVLDSSGSPGDYPRGFKIEASTNGETWQPVARCPDATAAQQDGVVTVVIPPTALRYVKITQTGPEGSAGGLWWSIHELGLSR